MPICTTTGDGWHWEPSDKWLEAKRKLERQRVEQLEEAIGQGQQQQQQQNQRPPPRYGGWHAGRTERFGANGSLDTGRDLDEADHLPRPISFFALAVMGLPVQKSSKLVRAKQNRLINRSTDPPNRLKCISLLFATFTPKLDASQKMNSLTLLNRQSSSSPKRASGGISNWLLPAWRAQGSKMGPF